MPCMLGSRVASIDRESLAFGKELALSQELALHANHLRSDAYKPRQPPPVMRGGTDDNNSSVNIDVQTN